MQKEIPSTGELENNGEGNRTTTDLTHEAPDRVVLPRTPDTQPLDSKGLARPELSTLELESEVEATLTAQEQKNLRQILTAAEEQALAAIQRIRTSEELKKDEQEAMIADVFSALSNFTKTMYSITNHSSLTSWHRLSSLLERAEKVERGKPETPER